MDWNLLEYPAHQDFHRFMKDLNRFYLDHPAFSEMDYDTDGFEWLECHAQEKCVYVFERRSEKERIMAVFNFSDQDQEFEIQGKNIKELKKVFSSEYPGYGSAEEKQNKAVKIKKGSCLFRLKPFSAEYYMIG